MNQETFEEIVHRFNKTTDKHGHQLKMNDLLIQKEGIYFHHSFRHESLPSDTRSISKTIMTIVLGVVMKQVSSGQYRSINDETYIYPIIKDVINISNEQQKQQLKKVQIKHLLTHTIGYKNVLLMRDDIQQMDPYEYLNDIINEPIVYEPGEHYLYSNAGFYLLSVVLQEFIEEDLLTFMEREVFYPLGIKKFIWEKYGNYVAGATRLWLKSEALLRFGELLLNHGKYQGKQLLSKYWIEKMLTMTYKTPVFDTPGDAFRRYGYGYGIWLAKDSLYFGHGTDGQTLTIIPDKETIIVTLAEQPDFKPIERIINQIIYKYI